MCTVQRDNRAELLRDLRNVATGCLGSDRFRAEAAAAVAELEHGAVVVRVGHMTHEVTDPPI